MEIKYTIEILTKDIQDIEKLVGNLKNSKGDSTIELDLALSKLRNVYEILTMIKADRLNELVSEMRKQGHSAAKPAPAAVPDPLPAPEPEPETAPVSVAEPDALTPSSGDPEESTILAEKFSAESSINENLAGKRGKDIDAKLMGQAIENISRNIGINDRFLIIREIFNGDEDRFKKLISSLDSAENYEAAAGILEEQLASHMEHEGLDILSGLVKRRFIR